MFVAEAVLAPHSKRVIVRLPRPFDLNAARRTDPQNEATAALLKAIMELPATTDAHIVTTLPVYPPDDVPQSLNIVVDLKPNAITGASLAAVKAVVREQLPDVEFP